MAEQSENLTSAHVQREIVHRDALAENLGKTRETNHFWAPGFAGVADSI